MENLASLWKALEANDGTLYLRRKNDPALQLMPKDSATPRGAEALLHIHRYQKTGRSNDPLMACQLLSESLVLDEYPEYAFFFHLAASQAMEEFEISLNLSFLDRSMDALLPFLDMKQSSPHTEIMGRIRLACLCFQYSVVAQNPEPLQFALDALNEAQASPVLSQWTSSAFGEIRSIIFLAHVVSVYYHSSFPPKDISRRLGASRKALDALFPTYQRHSTALQIIILAVILFLCETTDDEVYENAVNALIYVTSCDTSSGPPSLTTLSLILDALEHTHVKSSDRVVCLLHMADCLAAHLGRNPQLPGEPVRDDTREAWYEDWVDTLTYLQNRLKALGVQVAPQDRTFPTDPVTPPSRQFMFSAKFDQSSSPQGRLYRMGSPGEHECMFTYAVTTVSGDHPERGTAVEYPHHGFLLLFEKLSRNLNHDQVLELIQKPETIPFSPFLANLDPDWLDQPLLWRKSPGLISLLILHPTRLQRFPAVQDYIQAARSMLQLHLFEVPAYSQSMYNLAARLRTYESTSEAIDVAAQLFKEVLGAQDRGTKKHWATVVDLAVTSILEYIYVVGSGQRKGRRRPELVGFAMELLRDALDMEIYLGSWQFELKKIIVIGRVLQYRLRDFWTSETEESLCEAVKLLLAIWDIIPPGGPFRASVLETMIISTILSLAQSLPVRRWFDSLKLLFFTLELRLQGESSASSSTAPSINHPRIAVVDLLASGIDTCSFGLRSEAICLLHITDLIRFLASDCAKYPGFLGLSLDVYVRSLQGPSRHFDDDNGVYNAVLDEWGAERALLKEAVDVAMQDLAHGGTPSFRQQPLGIYFYRATTSKPTKATSFSHDCSLEYYATKLSRIEVVDIESTPQSPRLSPVPGSPSDTAGESRSWPENLLSPPNNSDDEDPRRRLPSTVLPFIHRINLHDSQSLVHHPVFDMPISDRAIRAYIRSLHTEVRHLDSDISSVTETLIRHNASATYWNPADVLLGNRMEKLKRNMPFFTSTGPLQTLIARGPERCLELLEVARSLFWSKLLRLRTPFDDLPLPDRLRTELNEVAEELEKCKAQSHQDVSQEEAKIQYDLEWRFHYLLAEARSVPGMEQLLMPKNHEQLLEVAHAGPVVMLIGNDSIYAALIIQRTGVDYLFLDDLNERSLDAMILGLNKATNAARGALLSNNTQESEIYNEAGEHRAGRKKGQVQVPGYTDFLGQLWDLVVRPVLENLGLLSHPTVQLPRLWWCPTGKFAFLPIHAAGVNFGSPTSQSTSKYVVSSYTPTLSALMDTRVQYLKTERSSTKLKALVLAQPTTPELSDLPMTLNEVEVLEEIIPSNHLIRVDDGETSLIRSNTNRTVQEAISHLSEASILHLACHGHQDRVDPLNSGFQLEDGRLTISRLITASTPVATLAFLSACESASNDFNVPDESLNLTVAMLYAGFCSVIGTMWSMNDNDGPEVARLVYEQIFAEASSTGEFNPTIVPYALHRAIQRLQTTGVHPSRWATYIHVGM